MWVSTSTATSAKTAPQDCEEYVFRIAALGSAVLVISTGWPPLRRMMSTNESDFEGEDLETRRPDLAKMSSAGQLWSGDCASLMARSVIFWRSLATASRTAGVT